MNEAVCSVTFFLLIIIYTRGAGAQVVARSSYNREG